MQTGSRYPASTRENRSWSACLFLSCAVLAGPHRLPAQHPCSNDEVVKMVQAHLSTTIIVTQIQNSPGNYCLNADSLIKLQHLGVPDEVISAMQQAQPRQGTSGRPAAGGVRSAPGEESESGQFASSAWKAADRNVDEGYEWAATSIIPVNDRGHKGTAEVVATCPRNPGQRRQLLYRIYYTSQDGPVGFIHQSQGQTIEPTCTIAPVPVAGVEVTAGGCQYVPVDHPNYVPLEISIDSRYASLASESPHGNELLIDFEGSENGVGGSLGEAVGARDIAVRLPLTNGDTPVIDVRPQAPGFDHFVDICDFSPKDLGRPPVVAASPPQSQGLDPGFPPPLPAVGGNARSDDTSKRVVLDSDAAQNLLLTKTYPVYPPIAKAAGVSGTVVLKATISKTGAVENVTPVSGPPMLIQAAVIAVKSRRYQPYLVNNEPVEVETTVNVVFTLGAGAH
jgi:TonB family protein